MNTLTLAEAKELKPGDIVIDTFSQKRWKVTGKVRTWKTREQDFDVPIKYGLYDHWHIKPSNLARFRKLRSGE